MKRFFFILTLYCSAFNVTGQELSETEYVYFDTDKYELSIKAKQQLDKIIKSCKIELAGHTDSDAEESHNIDLSKNRVLSVYDYLIKAGFNSDQIKYAYFGEKTPIVNNTDTLNKWKNRRVEIKVFCDGTKSYFPFDTLYKKPQIYIISHQSDTILYGKEGTVIEIPGNSFQTIDNTKLIGNEIIIELTEFYKKSDMFFAN